MFTRGVSEEETPRFFLLFAPAKWGCALALQVMAEGARGSVFQTGLPFRQESGGLKTPGFLRDRPTDGAALDGEIYTSAGGGVGAQVMVGGCAGMVSQGCGGNDVRVGARVY